MDERSAEISRLQAEIAERHDRLTELMFGQRVAVVSVPIKEGWTFLRVETFPDSRATAVSPSA